MHYIVFEINCVYTCHLKTTAPVGSAAFDLFVVHNDLVQQVLDDNTVYVQVLRATSALSKLSSKQAQVTGFSVYSIAVIVLFTRIAAKATAYKTRL